MGVDGLHDTDDAADFELDIVEAINDSFVEEVSWDFAKQGCCIQGRFPLCDHPSLDSRYR